MKYIILLLITSYACFAETICFNDGRSIDGEIHYFIAKGAGNVNLTGSNNIQGADSNGSFFQMETGSALTLVWQGSKWQILSSIQAYDSANTNPIRLV